MFESLKRLVGLLSRRKHWQAVLLLGLLIVNALIEMIGVGLVPIYISILAQPERLLAHEKITDLLAYLGVKSDQLSPTFLLYWGTGLLLALFTLRLVYTPLVAYVRARYVQSIVRSLSTKLFQGYMRAPYVFHLSRNTAELIRNVNAECMQLGMKVLYPMAQLATQLLVTIAIIVLLLVTMPGAAFFALLVILGFAIPLLVKLNRRIKSLALRAQEGRKGAILSVQEGLGGVKELCLYGRESFFLQRFQSALRQVLDIQRFQQVLNTTLPVMMEWVSVAALLAVVVVLFRVSGSSEEVLATAAMFAVAMARLKGTVASVLQSYMQVHASLVSVDVVERDLRHLDELSAARRVETSGESPAWKASPEEIECDDVWYRYPGADRDALRGINLSIRKGEVIGFVGPSGSGKSTLIDVLLGVLTPRKGAVRADGVDIQTQLRNWHGLVGYIPQSIYLFDGTVRQNIALGFADDEIDDGALRKALDAANLTEFIQGLPDELDTVVGERGVRFSGGQRQRVAIARALYNDPPILVMDEATSALDNLTEKVVMEAVDALKGTRTILMIAHRLSTVRNCDRIVFMQDGNIQAIGNYEELTRQSRGFQLMAQEV